MLVLLCEKEKKTFHILIFFWKSNLVSKALDIHSKSKLWAMYFFKTESDMALHLECFELKGLWNT